MSLFGKIFAKPKKQVDSPQEAIQKLLVTEDLLTKKQAHLESKIREETETAVRHGMKNKKAALQALNRKRQHEKNLSHIDGVLQTLDFQRQALENASTNAEVLNVMGAASKTLKKAHNNMNIDDVQEIMEDIAEQNELANEISEMLAQPSTFGMVVDEDELMADLELLMEEENAKQQHLEQPTPVRLPDVPSRPLPAAQTKSKAREEEDLDELSNWASA